MTLERVTQPENPPKGQRSWQRAITRPRAIAALTGLFIFLIGWHRGGYGLPIAGEIAIVAAWMVLIGAVLGVIPSVRLSGWRLAAVCALGAFVGWDLISLLWTDAADRTVASAVQFGAVFSVLLAATVTLTSKDRVPVLAGLLLGVSAIAAVATGSRLHPDWFPGSVPTGEATRMRARLSWPVGYWNALAYLCGMALPIGIAFSTSARRGLSRAAAGASVPLLAVTVLFALSRGGIAAAALAVVAGFLLGPIDLKRLIALVASAASSGVVIVTALSGSKLMDGLTQVGSGERQARTTLLVLIAASLAMASISVALDRLPPRRSGGETARARPWLRAAITAAVLAAAAAVFFVAGGGPKLDKAIKDFNRPAMNVGKGRLNSVDRLSSQNNNGRLELWKGAIRAGNAKPLTGNGGGTFETWWNRHRSEDLTVRNAHSYYLEAYAELGWIGAVLAAGLIFSMLVGAAFALPRTGSDLAPAAGGTGAILALALSGIVDWGWQVTVLPIVAALAFAAVSAPGDGLGREGSKASRALLGVLAALLLALAVPPTVASHAIVDSRGFAAKGEWAKSIGAAQSARNWQPYSADAWLQQGLAEEGAGNLVAAKKLVIGATERDTGDWKSWLALAGIEAKQGHVKAALADYRKARDRNPLSPLFAAGN